MLTTTHAPATKYNGPASTTYLDTDRQGVDEHTGKPYTGHVKVLTTKCSGGLSTVAYYVQRQEGCESTILFANGQITLAREAKARVMQKDIIQQHMRALGAQHSDIVAAVFNKMKNGE